MFVSGGVAAAGTLGAGLVVDADRGMPSTASMLTDSACTRCSDDSGDAPRASRGVTGPWPRCGTGRTAGEVADDAAALPDGGAAPARGDSADPDTLSDGATLSARNAVADAAHSGTTTVSDGSSVRGEDDGGGVDMPPLPTASRSWDSFDEEDVPRGEGGDDVDAACAVDCCASADARVSRALVRTVRGDTRSVAGRGAACGGVGDGDSARESGPSALVGAHRCPSPIARLRGDSGDGVVSGASCDGELLYGGQGRVIGTSSDEIGAAAVDDAPPAVTTAE